MLLLVVVMGSGTVFAQGRFDVGVKIPRVVGIAGLSENDTSGLGSVTANLPEILLVPSAMLAGQLDLAIIKLGVGLNMYPFILINVVYPAVFAELDLGIVAAQLNIGGGVFGIFGPGYGDIVTSELIIPDLSVHLKLGSVFQIGGGVMAFSLPEFEAAEISPFIGYLSAKLSFTF